MSSILAGGARLNKSHLLTVKEQMAFYLISAGSMEFPPLKKFFTLLLSDML